MSQFLASIKAKRLHVFIIIAMTSVYFFSFFQRVAVPGTVFNEIQNDPQLGGGASLAAGAVTALGAIYLYIYGGVQLFVGAAIDRLGAGRVLLAGGLLLCLGSVLFPLSPGLDSLYASRALVGLGASVMFLALIKSIDSRFSERNFAPILGCVLFAGYAGGLFATAPLQRMVAAYGWRNALLIVGVVGILFYIITLLLVVKEKERKAHDAKPFEWGLLAKTLFNFRAYPVLIVTVMNFSIYFVVQSNVGKKMLEDCCGITSAQAANATFVMMLLSMAVSLFGGMLSRMLGNRRKPFFIFSSFFTTAMVASMAVCLMCGKAEWMPYAMVGSFIALGLSNIEQALTSAAAKESNPAECAAFSVGFLNSAVYLFIAILCTISGRILDAFSAQAVRSGEALLYPPEAYRNLLLVLLGAALVSCVFSFFIKETHGGNIYVRPEETTLA